MIPYSIVTIAQACADSPIGKKLPNALYVHISALPALPPLLQDYEAQARTWIETEAPPDLIKFNTEQPRISYLYYPRFDPDPHPAIAKSIMVDLQTQTVQEWDYHNRDNPPILHRKETFVTPDYPHYDLFAHLTHCEEALGLLKQSRRIGTRNEWEKRLSAHHIAFEGHYLTCGITLEDQTVDRHRAAIFRTALSRPVRLGLELELFAEGATFFDYGCGHGGDVERLTAQGVESTGWDPYYRPHEPQREADIVNLGYVINVIEDLGERRQALLKAWQLTRQVLIVSAQVLIDDGSRGLIAYGDGIITRRNTFQKYYEQEELKAYIDQVLGVDSIPISLGIYFVFRDEEKAQFFRASRFHSHLSTPRIYRKVRQFEDYETLLTPLIEFVTKRGRLPVKGELENEAEIRAEFGYFRRAFALVLRATNLEEWTQIEEKRRQELLLYLALSQFTGRPKYSSLTRSVREDIKAFFGNYKKACLLADLMLVSLRDLENIKDYCFQSSVGIKTSHFLLVHISALAQLDPLLRLYEGTASRTFGRLEDTTLIQLYFNQAKITYFSVPDFDTVAHPKIVQKMQVNLQNQNVYYQEFDPNFNPPLLHSKNRLVTADYPNFEKFSRLTAQEQNWGILEQIHAFCLQQDWLQRLNNHCAEIRGHRVYWRKDCDPYQVKLLKSKIYQRKKSK